MYATYVIQEGQDGPVTIGALDLGVVDMSKAQLTGLRPPKLVRLLDKLQEGNPTTLGLVMLYDKDERFASELIKEFAKYRLAGCWFRTEVLNEIGTHAAADEAYPIIVTGLDFERRDALRLLTASS